jgi:hypothetical protein
MKKVAIILCVATVFSCSGQTNQCDTMKFLFNKHNEKINHHFSSSFIE